MKKATIADKTVLISGASSAGPALAYWLSLYGFKVTIVEKMKNFLIKKNGVN